MFNSEEGISLKFEMKEIADRVIYLYWTIFKSKADSSTKFGVKGSYFSIRTSLDRKGTQKWK